ncbi:MAG: hypothetical protein ISS74_02240 [Planctomycetes bacterium]|nr:hypothetical protein [Planctomycetota bacterium]
MRRSMAILVTAILAAAGVPMVRGADAGAAPGETRMLAVRAAQVDGVNRLTLMVLDAGAGDGKTVRDVLGANSPKETDLRVFLRSARMVGFPRLYSDGVAEVDVEAPADVVVTKVAGLCGLKAGAAAFDDLRSRALDGCLRTSGTGRAPAGLGPEVIAHLASAPPEVLPEMFPAGWERVTATGRVMAVRAARVDAYRRMRERLEAILLGPTETVGDLVRGAAVAEAAFDAYVRSLSVAGPPRLMPDRIAEVEVAAPVRSLIEVLKDIRRLRGGAGRSTDEQIDRVSVRIKSDAITVTGRGMPPDDEVRASAGAAVAGGAPLPDWATDVIEARGTAALALDVPDPERARLLAARSAKARALAELERKVDAIDLGGGVTVRQRAAKDAAFRGDLETFLESARTVTYRGIDDGQAWEVVLRVPMLRLYECSRRGG